MRKSKIDMLCERTFTAGAVAMATGTTARKIADWCSKGLIVGHREPLGRGRLREFHFSNVMEVATALKIMKFGIEPGGAFRIARLVVSKIDVKEINSRTLVLCNEENVTILNVDLKNYGLVFFEGYAGFLINMHKIICTISELLDVEKSE